MPALLVALLAAPASAAAPQLRSNHCTSVSSGDADAAWKCTAVVTADDGDHTFKTEASRHDEGQVRRFIFELTDLTSDLGLYSDSLQSDDSADLLLDLDGGAALLESDGALSVDGLRYDDPAAAAAALGGDPLQLLALSAAVTHVLGGDPNVDDIVDVLESAQ
jgi:hypothetical protein